MHGLSDTSPDVERLMVEAYRRMSPDRKWRNLFQDYRMARALHAAGVRTRRPGVTLAEVQADWIAATLGHPCPVPIGGNVVEPSQQEFQPALVGVIRVLDRFGIGYAVGGSIASSLHGIGRFTRDADLTAEPFPGREAAFAAAFDPADFYVSPDAVREAVAARSTFNILHPASGYKVDIFVRANAPFELAAFARRVRSRIPEVPDDPVFVHSPEDILLFKFRWYRLGGETSDRQWTDIMGVMKTQAGRLDDGYLDRWAADLGVADLLARARAQV